MIKKVMVAHEKLVCDICEEELPAQTPTEVWCLSYVTFYGPNNQALCLSCALDIVNNAMINRAQRKEALPSEATFDKGSVLRVITDTCTMGKEGM